MAIPMIWESLLKATKGTTSISISFVPKQVFELKQEIHYTGPALVTAGEGRSFSVNL